MKVTVHHVRTVPGFGARPGFCMTGARRWFRHHGLDWRAFLREGIEAEQLRATNDGFAIAVCDWAERSAAHGR